MLNSKTSKNTEVVKPHLSTTVNNRSTSVDTSHKKIQEMKNIRFINSSSIQNVFKANQFIDFKVPNGFRTLSKTEACFIELEIDVSKDLAANNNIQPQTLFAQYTGPQGSANGLTLTTPNNITSRTFTLPANSINGDNSTNCFFSAETELNSGRTLFGTYTVTGLFASSSQAVAGATRLVAQIGYIVGATVVVVANSADQVVAATSTLIPAFNITVPLTIMPEGAKLILLFNVRNTVSVPSSTSIQLLFQNNTPNQVTLQRNIYLPDAGSIANVINLPCWTMLSRIEYRGDGTLLDEWDQMNYFSELAFWPIELLKENSKGMLMDKDTYSILYDYPGQMIFANGTPNPVTRTQRMKVTIPIYNSILQTHNWVWDLINDEIVVRLFLKPLDEFAISSPLNAPSSYTCVSASLNMTGVKFDNNIINAMRETLTKQDMQSHCLLRKYGYNNFVNVQNNNGFTYQPLQNQLVYDLSYLMGDMMCVTFFIYPNTVGIGGENFCQLLLPYDNSNGESLPVTFALNENVYPIELGLKRSQANKNLQEYLYTPQSGFKINKINILDDTGLSIFNSLNFGDYYKNIMSQTGNKSDFFKTYSLYPFIFTDQLKEDLKNQNPEGGSHYFKNVYNVDVILQNPESSTLPIYDAGGQIVKTLPTRLCTAALARGTININKNGKIRVVS